MKPMMYVYALASLLVIDSLWLGLIAKTFYKKHIGYLMGPVNFVPAGMFYLLYAAGIVTFVVLPSIKGGYGLWQVFALGAFLGLIAYGAYDFTNQATIKDWPLIMTVVDLAWGGLLTGLVSVLTVWLVRK